MINNSILRNATTFFSAIYLGLFLTGLISYVGSQFNPRPVGMAVLTYLIYGLGFLLCALVFLKNTELRTTILKASVIGVIGLLPVLVNGSNIGGVVKSYIVGVGSLLIISIIAAAADRRSLGVFSASLVCVISIFCLFDVCFYDGLTNTKGRAAALFVNPNIAAIVILIATVGSIWAVPSRLRLAFIIVAAGAVFSTLSRTAMFLSFVTFLACLPLIKANWREHICGLGSAFLTAMLVIALLAGAYANNKSFGVAIESSFRGLILADSIWTKARSDLENQSQIAIASTPASASSVYQSTVTEVVPKVPHISTQFLKDVEKENSAAARVVLLQRALIEYRSGPVFGSGLERAFELGPHNSYVLFAVAFGHLGWLIVPFFAMVILLSANWRRGLPSAVLILGAAFFSHDLFTSIPIIAAMAVVLSGLISQNSQIDEDVCEPRHWGVGAAVATLALTGLISILLVQAQYTKPWSASLQSKDMSFYGGNAYYAALSPPRLSGLVRVVPQRDGNHYITEDRQILRACDSSADEIITFGGGRCQYENMGVLFSTADNRSPLENGREYHFSALLSTHPLYVLMVAILFLWAAFWGASVYRHGFSGER